MTRSDLTNAAAEMEKDMTTTRNSVLAVLTSFGRMVTLGALALVLIWARLSVAQQSRPRTFSSAAEAARSLFLAVRNGDEQSLGAILGGAENASTSDEAQDRLERDRFSQKYEEMHRVVEEPDGRAVLYIGAENWPFPIPLASKNGRWYFDSDGGNEEIRFRRVGENETIAIEVCRAFAAATKHEAPAMDADSVSQYARSLLPGGARNAHDREGSTLGKDASPFHGYYFQTGVEQTRGNAYGSPVKEAGRVVLIGIPAEYRESGVMTFIVTQNGVVYEKDLGPDAATLGGQVLRENAAKSWHTVR